ncbi:MAG TPA: hypothetical protein VFC02_05180 [Anaerolineales bacterium]|nr:hypothetical protein [Anaerolineales bacterium]
MLNALHGNDELGNVWGDTAMQNTVKAKLSQQKIKECNHSLELKNEIIGELKLDSQGFSG